MEKEIVGYTNEAKGYILCSRCSSEYCDDAETPDEIKKEFIPIYKGDDWAISPSCTQCNDVILF